MPRMLTSQQWERIRELREQGLGTKTIVKTLRSEGTSASRNTVKAALRRGGPTPLRRSAGPYEQEIKLLLEKEPRIRATKIAERICWPYGMTTLRGCVSELRRQHETGVELLLEPRTRVPAWIRNQTLSVSVGSVSFQGRRIRSLKIRGGTVSFLPGGSVGVKMPGSHGVWVAFRPLKVLEIRDLKGTLIERNHDLCPKCGNLAGSMVSHTQPSTTKVAGLVDGTFECTQCGHRWELEGI